jgi:metal-responsive CopG/Arc/MetJ family transcriptional regulator
MRVKTSVSLSNEVLQEIASFTVEGERSDFIEKAIWNYVQYLHRTERNRQDLEKINNAAAYLNSEAMDTLSFQVPW